MLRIFIALVFALGLQAQQSWQVTVTLNPDGGYAITDSGGKPLLQLSPDGVALLSAIKNAKPAPAINPNVTDPKTVFKIPAAPASSRWKTFTDPTFGTTVLQLTGVEDGTSCGIQYGMWPVFNMNDTMALAGCGNTMYAFKLNPDTLEVTGRLTMNPGFNLSDAYWSHTDPNVLYMRSHYPQPPGIDSYNVATGEEKLLVDLSQQMADAPIMFRMTMSEDDNVFCWTRETTDWRWVGFGCWRSSDGSFFKEPADQFGKQAFKVQIDKSGRWLWNNNYDIMARGIYGEIYDLQNGGKRVDTLIADGTGKPDYPPGHNASGPGYIIGANAWNCADTKRTWASPHQFTYMYQPCDTTDANGNYVSWYAYGASEFTMLQTANDYYWVIYSPMGQQKDGLYSGEIVGRATDGSGKIKRIVHTHGIVDVDANGNFVYWTVGQASISYTGRLMAFHSNWGNAKGRMDAYVVKVP